MVNKNKLFLIFLALILALPLLSYAQVQVQVPDQLTTMSTNLQNAAVTIGWSLLVIGFIIAGGLYLTSIGDMTKMTIAKKALTAAIIGGVVLVIAGAANALRNIIQNILNTGT